MNVAVPHQPHQERVFTYPLCRYGGRRPGFRPDHTARGQKRGVVDHENGALLFAHAIKTYRPGGCLAKNGKRPVRLPGALADQRKSFGAKLPKTGFEPARAFTPTRS